jgi:hypothetical protein
MGARAEERFLAQKTISALCIKSPDSHDGARRYRASRKAQSDADAREAIFTLSNIRDGASRDGARRAG